LWKNRAYAKKEPKKHAVMTLVERDGESRSFHVANVKAKTLREKIVKTVSRKSHLMTDELASYEKVGKEFANHDAVNHSANEFARLGDIAHINTAECRFSLMKTRRLRHTSFNQRSPSISLSERMGFQMEYRQDDRRGTCANCPQGNCKRLTYRPTNEATHD
jgi:transposase-like protein